MACGEPMQPTTDEPRVAASSGHYAAPPSRCNALAQPTLPIPLTAGAECPRDDAPTLAFHLVALRRPWDILRATTNE